MTNNDEITAAAQRAADHYKATRECGQVALKTLITSRAEDTAATTARDDAAKALDGLADAKVTGATVDSEAVQVALLGLVEAESRVRWTAAVTAAAQREVKAAQAELVTAEQDAMATSERARKLALHSRVLEIVGGQEACQ